MTYTEMIVVAESKKGHVSNVRLFEYLDEARKEWYEFCTLNDIEAVIVHIGVNYKKEVFHNDKLLISTSLERVGNTSITLQQRIENEQGGLLSLAEVVLASINPVTRTKVPVPDEVRCLLDTDDVLDFNKVGVKRNFK